MRAVDIVSLVVERDFYKVATGPVSSNEALAVSRTIGTTFELHR